MSDLLSSCVCLVFCGLPSTRTSSFSPSPRLRPAPVFFFVSLSSLVCRLGVFLVSCLGSGFFPGVVWVGLCFGGLVWVSWGQALLLGYSVSARFGLENAAGFRWGRSFRGSGVFFALLSLPPSSSSFFSGGRPGCLFSSFACFGARTPDSRYVDRREHHEHVFSPLCLLSLPGSVTPPSLLPPSALSLSLSIFFLASMHSVTLVDFACSHTLVTLTKPCLSQRKRFASQQGCKQLLKIFKQQCFCSTSPHMDHCGESRANTGDKPDLGGTNVIITHG